jgi:hypothetical protein
VNGELRAIVIRLEQIAGGREATGPGHGETETCDGVRRIAATDRYVKISKTIHIAAAKVCGQEVWIEIRNRESDSATHDIESEDAIVTVTIAESGEAQCHLD